MPSPKGVIKRILCVNVMRVRNAFRRHVILLFQFLVDLEKNKRNYRNCFPFSYTAARHVGAVVFAKLSVGKPQARYASIGPLFENWVTLV